jgi:hypothetical protein
LPKLGRLFGLFARLLRDQTVAAKLRESQTADALYAALAISPASAA